MTCLPNGFQFLTYSPKFYHTLDFQPKGYLAGNREISSEMLTYRDCISFSTRWSFRADKYIASLSKICREILLNQCWGWGDDCSPITVVLNRADHSPSLQETLGNVCRHLAGIGQRYYETSYNDPHNKDLPNSQCP